MLELKVTHCPHGEDLKLPYYATEGSAGLDLTAANHDKIVLNPNSHVLVPTGICLELPIGYEGQIRSRSGLAYKNRICVLNSPGTIDSDYRGEIKVILINLGQKIFIIERGMRIAQLVISKYEIIKWKLVTELSNSERNKDGLGSSGS